MVDIFIIKGRHQIGREDSIQAVFRRMRRPEGFLYKQNIVFAMVPLSGRYDLAGMWNVDPPQGEKITDTDRDPDKSPNQSLN
jgi:hypothetical protein